MEKSGQEPTLRGRIRVPSGIREFPPVRRYLIIPLFAALLAPALRASPATITIASRTLPRTVTVGGRTLALNGAGVRYYAIFFRVYVGALYLPTPTHSAHVALAEHGPDRIVMDFLRGVGHGDLVSAWKSGFRRNNSPTVRRALAPEIHRFIALWTRVHNHDMVLLDYVPGKGTTVRLDSKSLGVFPGRRFHEALLRIWLGPHPPTHSLKHRLLGRH